MSIATSKTTSNVAKKPKMQLVEKPNLMWLALTAITVDPDVQSRVETDLEHCRFLSGELEISGDLKPILVYFDGLRYWLANGFHRYHAYMKAGRKEIRAIIKPGGKTEAIIESAKNNDDASKTKTSDDRKRSLRMLLDLPQWRNKTTKELADYVGMSPRHTSAFIYNLETTTNIKMSNVTIGIDGRVSPRRKSKTTGIVALSKCKPRTDGDTYFTACLGGKVLRLGKDEDVARAAIRKLERRKAGHAAQCRRMPALAQWLLRRGILSQSLESARHLGVTCRQTASSIFIGLDIGNPKNVFLAVGEILVARLRHSPDKRVVALCYPDDAEASVAELLDLARQLGVEFLTPDEFVASVKGDAEPTD